MEEAVNAFLTETPQRSLCMLLGSESEFTAATATTAEHHRKSLECFPPAEIATWSALYCEDPSDAVLDKRLRDAAVAVICTRQDHGRVFVGAPSLAALRRLPPIVRFASGHRRSVATALDMATGETHTLLLEEWPEYDDCEDTNDATTELQEMVFHSEPGTEVIRFSKRYAPGDRFIRALQDPLKWSLVTHTVDLTKSAAGDAAAFCLAAVLHSSRKLKTLILDECSLTDIGAAHLVVALRANRYVHTVSLRRNPGMGDSALQALALLFDGADSAPKLSTLRLGYNNSICTSEKLWQPATIATFLTAVVGGHLTSLELCSCALSAADGLALGAAFRARGGRSALRDIDLSSNTVGDAVSVPLLDAATQLQRLNLRHCGLTAPSAKALACALGQGSLAAIDISSNDLSTETELEGGTEGLSDQMRVALAETRPAVLQLIAAIEHCPGLQAVDFSRCNVGDVGVTELAELLLRGGSSLTDLNISHNVNADEVSAQKLKELLCGGYFDSEADTARVQHLKSLNLAGDASSIGERALLALYDNKHLTSLDLESMGLQDGVLVPLCDVATKNPALSIESICLGRNWILYDGVRSIAAFAKGCRTLRRLDLTETWLLYTSEMDIEVSLSKARGEGIPLLKPLYDALAHSTLEELVLCSNDLTPAHLAAIEAAVEGSKLTLVDLRRNPLLLDAAVADPRIKVDLSAE